MFIKEMRLKHNIKQEQISKFLNISQPTFSNFENGEGALDEDAFHRLEAIARQVGEKLTGFRKLIRFETVDRSKSDLDTPWIDEKTGKEVKIKMTTRRVSKNAVGILNSKQPDGSGVPNMPEVQYKDGKPNLKSLDKEPVTYRRRNTHIPDGVPEMDVVDWTRNG